MSGGEFICIEVVIRVILAVICAAVASSKGRSVVGWFFLGFFFAIIPLIIICCLSNTKKDQADKDRVNLEQHRLREQLRQERLKNEAFRQYTAERLDAHDHVLGVDTRTAQALPAPPGGSPEEALMNMAGGPDGQPVATATAERLPPAAGGQPPAPRVSASAIVWYYELNGAQCGPVAATEIKALLESGTIRPTSLVWTEGLVDWVPVSRIPWFQSQVAS